MASTKEHKIKIMSNSRIFNGLTHAEIEQIYSEINPVLESYSKEEIVIREGEREKEFGIVIRDVLRGEKFHMEGNIHLVDVFEAGDIVSLESVVSRTKIAPITIAALTQVEMMSIYIEKLYHCSYIDKIKDNIIELLADENIKKLYKIDILSHTGLRDRIMTYLRIMSQKHHGGAFHIMMTQEQFAQYLSVNRSALSYELNKMRREGIIDFKKDKFVILKM
ncbi:MAG: Crp/Fnr family transcriptional regulator [Anaerovoracaceae bacterium]|jgi:CRP-like cAMP-binding protein